jgi:hypothetical protein
MVKHMEISSHMYAVSQYVRLNMITNKYVPLEAHNFLALSYAFFPTPTDKLNFIKCSVAIRRSITHKPPEKK